MTKVFEDEFMEVQAGLIDLCKEVAEGNPVEKIYAYCAVEEYSLMFHAFFMVNGKITRLHDLEGMTEGLESEFLHVGTGDLNLLRDLGKKYNRPIPAEMKLYYDVPSGKFHAEYDYKPAFVKNRRVGPEDTFRAWRDEMAGKAPPFFRQGEQTQQQLNEMDATFERHPPAAKGFDDEFAQVQARLIDLCVDAVEGFPVEKIYAYCAIKDRPLLFQPYYIVKGKVKDLSKLTGNDKEDMDEFFRDCIDELKRLPAIGAKYNRPIPAEIKLSFDMSTYQFHAEYDDNPFFLCWETFPYAKVYHAWQKDVAEKTPRFFWQRKK